MAFIRSILVGFIIFSVIMLSFYSTVSEMTDTYGLDSGMTSAGSDYALKVGSITTSLQDGVSNNILSGVPVIGQMIAGGALAVNVFKVILTMPGLVGEGVSLALTQSSAPPWVADFLNGIFCVLLIFAIIKFLFGREL